MGVYSRIVGTRDPGSPAGDQRPLHTPEHPAEPSTGERVLANVGPRIQEVLDAAERLAADIRAEAEAAAARHVEQRQREADRAFEERFAELRGIVDALGARAATVQKEVSELAGELGKARRRLARLGGGDPVAAVPDQLEGPDGPQPVAYPGTARNEHSREQGILRATQLAVAGTDRTEIERMLRSEFGIEDAGAVVDQLYGSGPA
jgi:hypothetical protein